jgi:hypothetical protein
MFNSHFTIKFVLTSVKALGLVWMLYLVKERGGPNVCTKLLIAQLNHFRLLF